MIGAPSRQVVLFYKCPTCKQGRRASCVTLPGVFYEGGQPTKYLHAARVDRAWKAILK